MSRKDEIGARLNRLIEELTSLKTLDDEATKQRLLSDCDDLVRALEILSAEGEVM
jgi:hypothetical protein